MSAELIEQNIGMCLILFGVWMIEAAIWSTYKMIRQSRKERTK